MNADILLTTMVLTVVLYKVPPQVKNFNNLS